MKSLMAALALIGLASPGWAAEPDWTWTQVMSTGQGLRTETGRATVTTDKRSIRISFFYEQGEDVDHAFRGTLGPPRVRPRFKNIRGFDITGLLTTEGTDYNDKDPMRGTYLKDTYPGRARNKTDVSCMETIVLSDGYNTITANRVGEGPHDC